jgi:peptide/nickel transport system permease protein
VNALPRATNRAPGARAWRRLFASRTTIAGLALLAAILLSVIAAPALSGLDANAIDLLSLNAPPGGEHPLGTDGVGRDVLARVLAGGRISLLVAFLSVAISMLIGLAIGAGAAFGGRWLGGFAEKSIELTMTLPPIVLLLVLSSITGPGIAPTILVIAVLSWPVLARLVRARLLELREREFLQASRAIGATQWHVLRRHALPNLADILIVWSTLQLAQAVLLEAGLSFLGLGVPPPAASWGNMLNAARSTAVLERYAWEWLAPGAALVVTTLAINWLGDGLRAALDPRAREE